MNIKNNADQFICWLEASAHDYVKHDRLTFDEVVVNWQNFCKDYAVDFLGNWLDKFTTLLDEGKENELKCFLEKPGEDRELKKIIKKISGELAKDLSKINYQGKSHA